jgi:hypothetical protein
VADRPHGLRRDDRAVAGRDDGAAEDDLAAAGADPAGERVDDGGR